MAQYITKRFKELEKIDIADIDSVVKEFILDFKKNPFLWDTEMDIHVELVSRLKAAFRPVKLKQKVYYDTYGGYIEVSLLSSGYPTELTDKKKSLCFPDIQIFNPIEDPESPPDSVERVNWPALWACEIKYKTEIGCSQNKRDWEKDKIKLMSLAKDNGGPVEHCYVLQMERDNSGAKEFCYEEIK